MLLQLLAYHDAGYEHGKFFEHNILKNSDSAITIIDLEMAKKHKCQRERVIGIIEGEVAPPKWSEYGCKEVYDYAMNSSIWLDRECCRSFLHRKGLNTHILCALDYVWFKGKPFYVSEIKSAEHLFSLLNTPDILPTLNAMMLE